jgi:hypothetical protein
MHSKPLRVLALAVSIASARCSSCKSTAAGDAGPPLASASASATPHATPAALSLPMAADHDASGGVWVAGFVAARNAINVSRFDAQGRLVASIDALASLKWSADAHVDVIAAARGALVVWRGIREGKRTRVAQWLNDDATLGAAALAIGSNACAAGSTVFTIGGKGGSSVVARAVPAGAEKSLVTIPEGHDPTLVCGEDKRAFVIDEGEDDMGVRVLDPDKASARAVLVPPSELEGDEMREHEDFTTGDVLRELLVTEKGRLSLHEYDGATVAPRRALDTAIASDEDLMAVDGNASHVVALLAREATARCDGDLGTDVLALDLPLPEGKEQVITVGTGACGHDLGPYWVAPTTDAVYVAWAIRGPRTSARSPTEAPVEALAWSKVGGAPSEIKLSAEDVVFAGCAKGRCMFVALTRPENTDGMVPGEARVIAIP